MLVKLESITIPQTFSESNPRKEKVKRHYDYYNKNNKLMKKVVIDPNYQIIDGYIDYLIAVDKKMDTVECLVAYGYNTKCKSDRREIRNILMQKSNGNCCICECHLHTNRFANKNYYATIDHIIPLSKGGEDSIDNMQITCSRCNSMKSNLLPSDFMYMIQSISNLEVQANA